MAMIVRAPGKAKTEDKKTCMTAGFSIYWGG